MKRTVLLVSLFVFVLNAQSPGIRPRSDANSYPTHSATSEFSIGAVLIPADQVKKMFKFDLNHAGYMVVEVGVFPGQGKDIDLSPGDFTLSVDEKSAGLRPVAADTIAAVLDGRPEPPAIHGPRDITTSAGVGVGHGTYTDPVTGRRTSGTVTETEAGVGVGGPPPVPCRSQYDCDERYPAPPVNQPSPTRNANEVSQELWERSLPDGKTVHAVAGYLYFPKPKRKPKDAAWRLRYENQDGKLQLPLGT
jgi:hypothetical protein